MYQNILVPMALDHDLSPETLAIAKALLADGGEITALHVYEAPNGSVAAYLDEEIVRAAVKHAEDTLADKLKAHPEVKGRMEKGHTARTIIDFAAANDIDCIVIGSHKPGLRDYLLGSTAAKVVRHAGCAVHVKR